MNIIILHGINTKAGMHWMGWLKQHLDNKHTVFMPQLPNHNDPDRAEWLKSVNSTLSNTNPKELIMVGHSLGVPTALDYIEESKTKVRGLISVSGFHADYGLELNSTFLANKAINMVKVRNNLQETHIIYSDNDPYVAQGALQCLAEALQVAPIVIQDGQHFNTQAGFTEFPLILEIIKRMTHEK